VTRGPRRATDGRGAARRHDLAERLLLLGPGIAYLLALFVVPLVLVASLAFFQRGRFGGIVWDLTLDNFSRALQPVYLGVLVDSVIIALATTLLALVIGYPTALTITKLPRRWRVVALVLVVLPFWTNFLIRTYAWIVLLNSEGPVNGALLGLGIIEAPLGLLYTPSAVVAGLLYAYLPLMILPLYATLERQDPELVEAANNLGASPLRAFLTVTVPLSVPGIVIGSIFVFVPSLGNFVIPELLGGGKTVMVGNLIRDQFLKARDWPFGAVLAISVIVLLIGLLVIQARVSREPREAADA
jgi:spermidine/putrescine transport system permease protein